MTETQAALSTNRARDEQTGKEYDLIPESKFDMFVALLSTTYLLFSLLFSLWLLFDVWTRNYSFVLGNAFLKETLLTQSFQVPAYAFIGGLLGGTVNGIRSIITWHSERNAFGSRFLYKYISLPWLGGTLALFSYALICSGVVAIGGSTPDGSQTASASLSMFSLGALAGYGSHKLFIWLDSQVNRVFKTSDSSVNTNSEKPEIITDPELDENTVNMVEVSVNSGIEQNITSVEPIDENYKVSESQINLSL